MSSSGNWAIETPYVQLQGEEKVINKITHPASEKFQYFMLLPEVITLQILTYLTVDQALNFYATSKSKKNRQLFLEFTGDHESGNKFLEFANEARNNTQFLIAISRSSDLLHLLIQEELNQLTAKDKKSQHKKLKWLVGIGASISFISAGIYMVMNMVFNLTLPQIL